MRVTHNIKYILILASIFFISACQEEQTIEPHGVKISFHAVTGLKSSADTLRIEEAFLGIGGIDLLRDDEADSASVEKIVYDGPYVVNLMNGTASPAIKWIFAEPGHYKKIEVTTFNSLPQGNTIVLKGYILPAGAGEQVPFEFITSKNYTLEIENNTGITIREGENLDLMVVFDLSDLFSGIDLTKLDKDERGVVMISDDNNFNSAIALMNTFETFSSFGIDDGLPFTGSDDETPDNEVPGEVDNPDEEEQEEGNPDENDDVPDEDDKEEEDTGNDDSGDSTDDEPDDSSSGNDSGGSDNDGGGASGEDDDNPEEDEGEETGSDNDDGEPDSDSGNNDDESDVDDGSQDDNPDGDEDEGDNDDNGDDDGGGDDQEGDGDGNGDDEEGDDDDNDDGDDDDKGKGGKSDENKDKDKGKGGKGKGKG